MNNNTGDSHLSWNYPYIWTTESNGTQEQDAESGSGRGRERDGTTSALLNILENMDPSEMHTPFHNGWSAMFVAAGIGCVRIVQKLITLGCDIETVIGETTALQIAMQKFHETGRVNYLVISDLLSGVQVKSIEEYKNSTLFKEHPINKQRAMTDESIQFLSEKKCLRVGCNKKVVVPYNYCGGRHKCCGEGSSCSSKSQKLENYSSNIWNSLGTSSGENESVSSASSSLIFNFNSFSHGSFEIPVPQSQPATPATPATPARPSSPQRQKRSHVCVAIEEEELKSNLFSFDSGVTKRKECSSSSPSNYLQDLDFSHKIQESLREINFAQLFSQSDKLPMSCSFEWLQEMPKGNTTFRQCCDIVARDC